MKVTLEQMLDARERRVEIQNKMLGSAGSPSCLVCLTLNIAGDVKRTPMTRMLFDRAASELGRQNFEVIDYYETDEVSGTEGFWLLAERAKDVKRIAEAIEEDTGIAASRLIDFDVLTLEASESGENDAAVCGSLAPAKLSRKEPRKCLLCESPAAECARSRRHGLDAVKEKTESMLREFCADTLAQAAYDSLIAELETTPKPGLVDLNNNGAHKDMDEAMLRNSAAALLPYFRDAALLGMQGCNMKELRSRGIEADREMFEATGGVNTHKGMVYSMGLLLAGMGRSLTSEVDYLEYASNLAKEGADRAFGATAHATAGFPDALYCNERLEFHRKTGNENTALVFTLIDSIAVTEDTNLLRRGGEEALSFARKTASEIASLPEDRRMAAVYAFDEEMIDRYLSPGGSADMLALACLIDRWKTLSRNM